MNCYTGKCLWCKTPCSSEICPWKTNDTGKWNTLKKEFLDFEICGTLYRTKKGSGDEWEFEAFDDGERGKRLNLMSIEVCWAMEGWYVCRQMRRSKKRKMRKLVERRIRRLRRKYKCEI